MLLSPVFRRLRQEDYCVGCSCSSCSTAVELLETNVSVQAGLAKLMEGNGAADCVSGGLVQNPCDMSKNIFIDTAVSVFLILLGSGHRKPSVFVFSLSPVSGFLSWLFLRWEFLYVTLELLQQAGLEQSVPPLPIAS